MNIKAVIFDFDGVIHDTFELAYGIFKQLSPQSSKDDYRDYFDGNILERVGKELTETQREKFRILEAQQFEELIIDSQIKEQIELLSNEYDLYIVSSNTFKNIGDYLERNRLTDKFKEVLASESGRSKLDKFKVLFQKYNVDVNSCVFVTDTLGDIREAHRVFLKTIACSFGYHSRERVMQGNPFAIASSFDEVRELIKTGF
ncbi:MAG TPA: HAD hydrolase-like protein [Oligoflexia bacterium]|nr:HAD hydrolase-like protein [Oligoflexia bacterium]HMP49744.1 HAD hydrolase-like protein [Oligoflexia bacterium]